MMDTSCSLDQPAARFLAEPAPTCDALAAALAQCATPAEAAWRLAETVGELLELSDCVVYLRSPTQSSLVQVAAWGIKQVAPGVFENPIRLPIGLGIVGACARDRVPVLIADTALDYRYVADVGEHRSELALPLMREGQLIGVLDSEHPDPDFYTSLHIRAVLRLAEQFSACAVISALGDH